MAELIEIKFDDRWVKVYRHGETNAGDLIVTFPGIPIGVRCPKERLRL